MQRYCLDGVESAEERHHIMAPEGRRVPLRLVPADAQPADDQELARGFDSYMRGTWNLLKAVGPKMLAQGSGTFLQIGTSSGVRTKEGFAALGACQHGLRALVQVAAREWRAGGGRLGGDRGREAG